MFCIITAQSDYRAVSVMLLTSKERVRPHFVPQTPVFHEGYAPKLSATGENP